MTRIVVAGIVLTACATAGAAVPAAPAATPAANPLAVRFREALKAADPQVAATPEWMRVHAAFVVQDWASMQTDAATVAARFPSSADPLVAQAVAYAGTGDLEHAATALEAAVAAQPAHRAALVMLAELRLSRGEYAQAAATLELARKVKPDDLRLLLALADAYVRSGEPARAVPVLEHALAVAPEDVPAWRAYLDASARSGMVEAARVAYNRLRISHPGTAAAVRTQLPASVAAVVPTPIPPTPRPTPRSDTPRLVMASGPTGGAAAGQATRVWNEAALGFEGTVAQIAGRARPLAEMVGRYDLTCQGGGARRGGVEGGEASEIDWKALWARTQALTDAAANAPTSECRALAADILALANATRAAVEKAVAGIADSGMSDTDRDRILQQYGLVW